MVLLLSISSGGEGMEYEILRRKTKQNQKTTQKNKTKQKSKSRRKKQQQKLITPKNCRKVIGPSCQTFKN